MVDQNDDERTESLAMINSPRATATTTPIMGTNDHWHEWVTKTTVDVVMLHLPIAFILREMVMIVITMRTGSCTLCLSLRLLLQFPFSVLLRAMVSLLLLLLSERQRQLLRQSWKRAVSLCPELRPTTTNLPKLTSASIHPQNHKDRKMKASFVQIHRHGDPGVYSRSDDNPLWPRMGIFNPSQSTKWRRVGMSLVVVWSFPLDAGPYQQAIGQHRFLLCVFVIVGWATLLWWFHF